MNRICYSRFIYFLLTLVFYTLPNNTIPIYKSMRSSSYHEADTQWTVIGAGGAGTITIGMLLDTGVPEKDITWVDPDFNVGRLGAYYYNVPGNSIAKSYITLVNECRTFQQCTSPALDYLRTYYPYECCKLQVVIDALRDITTHLRTKVINFPRKVTTLQFVNDNWSITLDNGSSFTSHNVVLATGSRPRTFKYPCDYTIPLDDALDKTRLTSHLQPDDTVALVGGSHSGILVLKYLHELPIKRIINFYLDPITYAYDMGNNNIPDYNGLKGDVADWAFNVLETHPPETIFRVKNTDLARNSWLPLCTKIIYAVGFERNTLPLLNVDARDLIYNDTTGNIAKRLFGIGIAFPEKINDPWGKTQHTVGLIDFLTYAQRVIPDWVNKKALITHLYQFNDLLTISFISPSRLDRSYHAHS